MASPATERDDADVLVGQQVEGDALLRRPAVEAEDLTVAADQAYGLVGHDPAEGGASAGEQPQAGVAEQVPCLVQLDLARVVQPLQLLGGHLEFGHAGVPGLDHLLGAVLLRRQPDGGRLDPQRQVLGDENDVVPLLGQRPRHREDARVVVAEPEPGRSGTEGRCG